MKCVKGCFTYTAGHIWPYKFVLHLLTKAVSLGVNLQTHTPVQQVSLSQDNEGYWTIATARGDIKAKTIVYASNAYTSAILPEYKDSIIPVRGICCRIVTPKTPAPYLPNSYILRWNEWEYEYLIPRTDGSIVVGGARGAFYSNLDSWYNTTDDSQLIDSAKKYFDGYMQRHFRGWEDSGSVVDNIWTGSTHSLLDNSQKASNDSFLVMGYSTDNLPHVGSVPSKPNQFIVAGFTGHGMPQIFLSARGIASMIMEGKEFKDTRVPQIYETTQTRLSSKRNRILETWEDSRKQTTSKL